MEFGEDERSVAEHRRLVIVALFVRFWLTATPALPEQTKRRRACKGGERYDRLVEALGHRLANGSGLLKKLH